MMIKLVLFDVGGVLCKDLRDQYLKRFTKVTGLSVAQLHDRLFHTDLWHRHDKGTISTTECWQRLLRRVPHSEEVPRLRYGGNAFEPDHAALKVALGVAKYHRVRLLTNMSAQLHRSLVKKGFPFSAFGSRYLSFRLGARKPEKEIYKCIQKREGLASSEILFIDDKERNLAPARRLGWRTYRYTSVERMKKELKKLGLGG